MTIPERVEAILSGLTLEERLRQRPVKAWVEEGVLGLSVPSAYRAIAEGRLGCVKHDGTKRRGGRGRSGKVGLTWQHVAVFLAERWVDAQRAGGAR